MLYKADGKGQVHPISRHESTDGEQRYTSTPSLTSANDDGRWLGNTTPRPLYLRELIGTDRIVSLVGPEPV